MMAAAMSSPSRTSAPAIAFGDVLDLARWRSRSPRSVCEACQTINLGSRRYCKGCTGRLPAYYTTSENAALQQAARHGLVATPTQARRRPLASGCMGAFLIAVAAIAGLPLIESSPTDASAERAVLQPLAPIALQDQVAVPVTVQPEPTTHAAAIEAVPEPAFSAAEEEDETIADSPVERPSRKAAMVRRQAVSPPQHVPGTQSASAQLARCDEMNFFARAMCVNRTCAQPSAARATSCAQPIRQRRLDEARRNPTLVG
ncbi:hypothetical protein [Variovorax sp. dw_308]|uniref:hypothetical protein n=1 Tax=Variovorax sp. dw_308 TaxID=2721546 RepID=UPI001C45EEE1|nr:hypothetical protein [Variovorax sp. dw_308]